jgi:hypothetical protein
VVVSWSTDGSPTNYAIADIFKLLNQPPYPGIDLIGSSIREAYPFVGHEMDVVMD